MESCFGELELGKQVNCAFISLDLEGHTQLLRAVGDEGVIAKMRHAYRELVYDCMSPQGLCQIKWDGDGGIFASYSHEDYGLRAVKACLAILDEWASFTKDTSTNPTRRGITLRIGGHAGRLTWGGDLTNLQSRQLNEAVHIEQRLRDVRAGAAKFAIAGELFELLDQSVKDHFSLDPLMSAAMAGQNIYRCTDYIYYALPINIPHFARQSLPMPYVVGYPIETRIVADNTEGDSEVIVEWSLPEQGIAPRWQPIVTPLPASQAVTILTQRFLPDTVGRFLLPAVAIRYRIPMSGAWSASQITSSTVEVEEPRPRGVSVAVSTDPLVPVARTSFRLVISLTNTSNLPSKLVGETRWRLEGTSQVQHPTQETAAHISEELNGYEAVTVPLAITASLPSTMSTIVHVTSAENSESFAPVTQAWNGDVEFNWDAPCVGRDDLISSLLGFAHRAFDGHGHIVVLDGQAGSGKSTVVAATNRELQQEGFATLPFQFDAAYAPAFAWVRAVLGMLEQGIGRDRYITAGVDIDDEIRKYHHVFEFFASSVEAASETQRNEAYSDFAKLLHSLSSRLPMALTIDDLHNADSSTLDLLEAISRLLIHSKVIVFGTTRSEEAVRPAISRFLRKSLESDAAVVIKCPSIDEDGIEAWLRSLFDGSILRAGFAADLRRVTDGRALYVKNCLLQLYAGGKIAYDEGRTWFIRIDEQLDFTFGVGLDTVLRRTFEQLSPEAQVYAQRAAVIGMVVPYRVLIGISDETAEQAENAIKELIDRQILRYADDRTYQFSATLASDTDDLFIFDHGRLQEVIYQTILNAKRQDLHRRVAELLEVLHQARLNEFTSVLAYHWSNTSEVFRALPYVVVEAGAQFAAGGLAEALSLYRQVGAIVEANRKVDLGTLEAFALFRTAIIYRRQGDTDAVATTLDKARTALLRVEELEDHEALGLPSLKDVQHRIELLEGHIPGKDEILAELALEQGRQEHWAGNFTAADKLYQDSLRVAQQISSVAEVRHALRALGLLAVDRGDARQAVLFFENALATCDESTAPDEKGEVLQHLGRALTQRGLWGQARDALSEALQIGTIKRLLASVHNYLGETLRLQGNWLDSLHQFRLSHDLAEEVGERFTAAFTVSNRAKLAYHLGYFDLAIELANQYIAFCQQLKGGYPYGRGIATIWKGLSLFARGDGESGLALLEEAVELLSGRSMLYGVSLAHLSLGECLLMTGQFENALSHLVDATSGFQTVGDEYHATKAKLIHAEFTLASQPEIARDEPRSERLLVELAEIDSLSAREYPDLMARCWRDQLQIYLEAGSDSSSIEQAVRKALGAAIRFNSNFYEMTLGEIGRLCANHEQPEGVWQNPARDIFQAADAPEPLALGPNDLR